MRLVTIKASNITAFTADPEMLQKAKRPCVLIMQLKYKGRRQSFAVPIRSNIPAAAPKSSYFPLPPRQSTRPKNRHGIHYIKMFPIKRSDTIMYRVEGNPQALLIKKIIDENEKQIIKECQEYLNRYETGLREEYSTDIDLLLKLMYGE